jgi:hypothetical protein
MTWGGNKMLDLSTVSKEWLYEQLEAVEGERETIINLLNEALENGGCPSTCENCKYHPYCTPIK